MSAIRCHSIHPSVHLIFAEYLLSYTGGIAESETKALPLVEERWTIKIGGGSDRLVLGSTIWEGFSGKVA